MNTPQFRSVLVSALPGDKRRLSTLSLLLRWLAISLIVVAIVITIIGVHLHSFVPDRLPGSILYSLHDNVFLVIKGYLFTQFYPADARWTLPFIGGTILLIWLFSLLTGISPLREPHIWMWQIAIRQPARYPRVLRLLKTFKQFGFSPHLVRLVVLDAWEKTRAELRHTSDDRVEPQLERLLALMEFSIQIEKLFRPRWQTPKELIQRWHLTALIVQLHDHNVEDQNRLWNRLDDLRQTISFDRIPQEQRQQFGAFGWGTLIEDMNTTFALSHYPARDLNDHMTAVKLDDQTWLTVYEVLERLIAKHEQRLNAFRAVYHYGERVLYTDVNLNTITPPPLSPDSGTTAGQLALQLAAHFALITGRSYLLSVYLDLLDSACLMIDALGAVELQHWAELVSFRALPPANAIAYPVEVHDIDALLAQNQLDDQQTAWDFASADRDDVLFQPAYFSFLHDIKVEAATRRAGVLEEP